MRITVAHSVHDAFSMFHFKSGEAIQNQQNLKTKEKKVKGLAASLRYRLLWPTIS